MMRKFGSDSFWEGFWKAQRHPISMWINGAFVGGLLTFLVMAP